MTMIKREFVFAVTVTAEVAVEAEDEVHARAHLGQLRLVHPSAAVTGIDQRAINYRRAEPPGTSPTPWRLPC